MTYARIFILLFSLPAFAAHSVTLTWTASSSANVSGYRVYRATISGGPYQLLGGVAGTSFVNGSNPDGTPLEESRAYFYAVSSVSGQVEGAKSPEVEATIPTTPAPPTNLKAVAK